MILMGGITITGSDFMNMFSVSYVERLPSLTNIFQWEIQAFLVIYYAAIVTYIL
jgi:hypothetical protein